MSALIAYSSQYLSKLGTLSTGSGTTVTAYIAAASASIEQYCRRHFALASYDEVYDVGQWGVVHLNNFPVVSLDKVYPCCSDMLTITSNQISVTSASYSTTATGITIAYTASGVASTAVLSFVTYPTIDSVVGAINGLGNGFTAAAVGLYGPYPSSDLRQDQYGSCKAGNSIQAWQEFVGQIHFDAVLGSVSNLWNHSNQSFTSFNYSSFNNLGSYTNHPGKQPRYRFKYTAGFSTIPEPIQQVCADMVMNMYNSTSGALISEGLGDYSYTLSNSAMDTLPLRDKQVLSMWRDRRP